ncbi:hypothetical protein [Butyrivibrio sp. XPD2002]|uniref:hypothetical protein n=1 Tax=Butyrivibrio sp. XPD2002 TaxID=1280665 RepID=UPI00041FF844|nr:hypothetical protein [Butyrivibrio sp. XPD2002]
MDIAKKLKKISVKLEICNGSVFRYPIEKQKAYIAHFHEPKNDIQRSYFQYRCQMKFNKWIISFFINLASFPLLLWYLHKSNDSIDDSIENAQSVFFANGMMDTIIPNMLREKAGVIAIVNNKKENLTKEDKKYIRALWRRYPFSFQFIVKCVLKIRYYSYEIQRMHPENIITCNEYSFTSSVLTNYCEEKGIKHINVMHGEKLFYMRDSFFRFHECYVWDDYYRKLFLQMRADQSQFRVAVPPSLQFQDDMVVSKTIDYTYYFGCEGGERLKTIVKTMMMLNNQGLKVAIRPHPRYSDLNEIRSYAPELEIEDCKAMAIEQSLKRTQNAISVYSTVLNQAYNNGIGVVIDDISDRVKYEKLEERQYIMLNKPHKLLSALLEKR